MLYWKLYLKFSYTNFVKSGLELYYTYCIISLWWCRHVQTLLVKLITCTRNEWFAWPALLISSFAGCVCCYQWEYWFILLKYCTYSNMYSSVVGCSAFKSDVWPYTKIWINLKNILELSLHNSRPWHMKLHHGELWWKFSLLEDIKTALNNMHSYVQGIWNLFIMKEVLVVNNAVNFLNVKTYFSIFKYIFLGVISSVHFCISCYIVCVLLVVWCDGWWVFFM